MTRPLIAALLLLASASASAQTAGCTYDTCALRVRTRFFAGPSLVQGQGARRVARLGLFAPHVEALASGSDSTKAHYLAFRSNQNRGGALLLVAAVASGVAIGLANDQASYDKHKGVVWASVGVGLVFSIWGGANVTKASDHLQQSIWFYNRDLPR